MPIRAANVTANQNKTGSSLLTNQVSTGMTLGSRRPRMPTHILPVNMARHTYQPIATPTAPKKIAGIIMVSPASVGGLFHDDLVGPIRSKLGRSRRIDIAAAEARSSTT